MSLTAEKPDHPHEGGDCVFCKHEIPFELPPLVERAAHDGRLVIFAGAGISTENSSVFPTSLYSDARSVVEYELSDDDSFPAVMSAFEEKFGRKTLIKQIIERLDYVRIFPYLDWASTRFHRELSTIRGIQTIITTNWDTAFEDICQARPFVVDDDYSYFDLPGRKVFKIHGSTRNVSTLIATKSDYLDAERSLATSALGSTLRHVLSTQPVVFTGFSLQDPDFQSIYRALLQNLGKARPPAYFVSPFESEEAAEFGLISLQTDGTFFLAELKKALVQSEAQLPDSRIDRVLSLGELASEAKDEILETMAWRDSVPLFYSLSYLDGMLDATGRISKTARSGDYTETHHLHHLQQSYLRLLNVAIERRRWWDATYINGYLNTLLSLSVTDDEESIPPLFEDFSSAEYPHRKRRDLPVAREDSGHLADRIVKLFDASGFKEKRDAEAKMRVALNSISPDVIPQHTPFLDGVIDAEPPTALR